MLTSGNYSAIVTAWDQIVAILISVIAIIVILAIGWITGVIAGKFVNKILTALNVDKLLITPSLKEKFAKANMKFDMADIGEGFAKWIIILLALIAATEIAGIGQVAQFLNNILNYIPNLIIAIIVLAIGIVIADVASKFTKGGFHAVNLEFSNLMGDVAKWVVIIFAVLVALDQLGLKLEFIKILFSGFVAMLALAGGIAFGLGGKDMAKETLERMRSGMK